MSHHKEEDMLNQYPDLSDEEDNQGQEGPKNPNLPNSQPHKMIKPNDPVQSTTSKPIFTAPLLFGGKSFIPPPPPPSKGKNHHYSPPPPPPSNHNHNHSYSHPQNTQNNTINNPRHSEQAPRPERERKNCIYVKNIPKHYNQVEKLMTFFKNEGQIREIKVNHQQSTAIVRFSREEDSIKFSHSKKAIFNRSFITYSLNEKDVVPLEYIIERQSQDSGKVKKPIEVQMKESRERLENVLADKIRAILFLIKNVNQESLVQSLKSQLHVAIGQKKMLQRYGFQQLESANKTIINEYDWTLTYTQSKGLESTKKGLPFQLQKKYGPVYLLQFTPLDKKPENQPIDPLEQKGSELVKLIFLGIKSSWEYYYQNSLTKSESAEEQNDLQVKGINLKSLFNEGKINKPLIPIITASTSNRQDLKEQLVEVLENGQVKIVKQQQSVIEPQVDQSQVHQVYQGVQSEPNKKEE